jgi:hypothetical protein
MSTGRACLSTVATTKDAPVINADKLCNHRVDSNWESQLKQK